MRRLFLGLTLASLMSGLVGCQSPCTNCGGRHGGGLFANNGQHHFRDSGRGMGYPGGGAFAGGGGMPGGGMLPGGGVHYRPATEPAGGPVPQYAYPYYTLRGPRDFLVGNPPSIGPY